ncbi:uncharacterized protein YegP (UPF0339 family) [Sphingobium sp. OAS761]|uniref:YegP family protein n=1 Tax=Sphingobium sp. OAS761 TaxID=2817901 RepID=UPI00209DDE11|nr:DUF1508 domain-containing protein [Sphingobium sp. OAS761]MCP1468654.1 uncharacterized protein YegP (UPF0339 family) [Sphingobium sp. OAS761]
MAYYKLYKDAASQWRWRYVSSNGRTIADSAEGYWNKQDAINGINLLKGSYNSPVIE